MSAQEPGEAEEEIVDPTSDMRNKGIRGQLAERPDDLNGRKLTIYSNNKQNANHFMEEVARAMGEEFPGLQIEETVYKPRASEPGSQWDLIEEVSQTSDIVLVGFGDCGSCSLYTVHDAYQFEKNGISTVSYSSDKFLKLSRFDALSREVPGLPIVEFEHPIADLDPDEVKTRKITDEIVEDTIQALTRPAEEVEDDFASRYSTEDFDGKPKFDVCTI